MYVYDGRQGIQPPRSITHQGYYHQEPITPCAPGYRRRRSFSVVTRAFRKTLSGGRTTHGFYSARAPFPSVYEHAQDGDSASVATIATTPRTSAVAGGEPSLAAAMMRADSAPVVLPYALNGASRNVASYAAAW